MYTKKKAYKLSHKSAVYIGDRCDDVRYQLRRLCHFPGCRQVFHCPAQCYCRKGLFTNGKPRKRKYPLDIRTAFLWEWAGFFGILSNEIHYTKHTYYDLMAKRDEIITVKNVFDYHPKNTKKFRRVMVTLHNIMYYIVQIFEGSGNIDQCKYTINRKIEILRDIKSLRV